MKSLERLEEFVHKLHVEADAVIPHAVHHLPIGAVGRKLDFRMLTFGRELDWPERLLDMLEQISALQPSMRRV